MSKILFIGDLNQYGRSYLRYLTLKDLGHDIKALSHTHVSTDNRIEPPSLQYRISWKLKIPIDDVHVNKRILQSVKQEEFDVIWIEKGNTIWPSTLKIIREQSPRSRLLSCSEDDMYVSHGHSFWYRLGLKYYDIVFTTKKYNLEELKRFGAQKTILFLDSYSDRIHKPMQVTEAERMRYSCDVGAIGAYEKERAESIFYLAEKGVRVFIWGGLWEKCESIHPNMVIKNQFLYGDEYAKAISTTKINLNFLRKINRDEVTSRSVEIPACGGFMLAERTSRHIDFFKEGQEAVFFQDNAELFKFVRYYLENESERVEIARAGNNRCLTSGYSMRFQLNQMLSEANQCLRK